MRIEHGHIVQDRVASVSESADAVQDDPEGSSFAAGGNDKVYAIVCVSEKSQSQKTEEQKSQKSQSQKYQKIESQKSQNSQKEYPKEGTISVLIRADGSLKVCKTLLHP